jgi:magnesium-transporting ATPase (P-type)
LNLRFVQLDCVSHGEYDASSPDERALVCGASHLGLELLSRASLNTIDIGFTNESIRNLMLGKEEKELIEDFEVFYQNQEPAQFSMTRYFPDAQKCDQEIDWSKYCENSSNELKNLTPVVSYKILDVFEFDNIRKRMSVVIRSGSETVCFLTKGADNHMIERAAPHQKNYIQTILEVRSILLHSCLRLTLLMTFSLSI